MPLLDHFHAPLYPRRHWESFHANWAGAMADALNERLLPAGYFAEEFTHMGARLEIDVATYEEAPAASTLPRQATVLAAAPAWAPPAPGWVIQAAFPDAFEVRVLQTEGGDRLVAAIELVSSSNKGRDEHRTAFAIKCASYLCQGISLILIDVVTTRSANLHNEMSRLLGQGDRFLLPAESSLYAVAYRPIVRQQQELIEAWPTVLTLGQPLPTLPLALNAQLCVPVDLEATYTAACKRRRIA